MRKKLCEEAGKASWGVNAKVAQPTGIRAKTLPGSKSQGDKTNPKQGSSVNPEYEDDDTPKQKEAKSAGGDTSPPAQGSSKISQPPQVTAEELDLTDDLEAIFEGTDLTEDFKAKALTIFETAVVTRINEKLEEITAEMQDEFEAEKEALADELSEQLDQYLNYVVEQWMEDNALAVETGIKGELAENFLSGLRELFSEHYVDVPEDKDDVLTDLANRVAELEDELNNQLAENVELNARLGEFERELVFAEMTEGLTETQIAKLEALVENVSFTDAEEFAEKIETLRESYFPSSQPKTGSFDDEDPIELNEETGNVDPAVKAYAAAISRTVKK